MRTNISGIMIAEADFILTTESKLKSSFYPQKVTTVSSGPKLFFQTYILEKLKKPNATFNLGLLHTILHGRKQDNLFFFLVVLHILINNRRDGSVEAVRREKAICVCKRN